MVDVLSPRQRAQNMSAIRGKDTLPEMVLRRGLHARGVRYRLHVTEFVGAPDLYFPRYRTVLFVHGCFWHVHSCSFFRMPATRREFWEAKLLANKERDLAAVQKLRELGLRVAIVWECSLRGKNRLTGPELAEVVESFLESEVPEAEFPRDIPSFRFEGLGDSEAGA